MAPSIDEVDAMRQSDELLVVKTAGHVDILRQRSFWGASLGHFCGNYLLYFMVTWLPFYLVSERHLSMQGMTMTASVYYLVDAMSAITSGRVSDFWIRKGYTTTLVRKTAMAMGFVMAAIAMAVCAARPHTYLPWLIAVGVGSGISGADIFAFSQTLAGPEAAGRWTGLQNGFGNLAGVIAPALTGFAPDRTGSFVAPMMITTAVLMVGAMAWVFVVGRVEQVNWAVDGDAYDGAAPC
jgi:ACS family D-galactonate transporter-like MFS transporter